MAILIDTCALIFVAQRSPGSERAVEIVQSTYENRQTLYVSPISAWKIGILVSKNRLKLALAPDRWFENVMERGGLVFAALTPDILLQSSFLPDSPLRDPADKIIAATAREFDYTVLTSDRLLLRYAAQGHLRAIAC